MTRHLPPLLWLCLVPALVAAEPPSKPAATTTNEMIILADDGFEYEPPRAVYRGNVHVSEPRMELMCELLTVFFQTNGGRIESVVAETNVVVIQQESWATGDRAVYTASNELVVLTGHVVLDTPQGYLLGPAVTFDIRRNKLHVPGRMIMGSHPGSGLFGTNAFGITLPGVLPPASRAPAPQPPRERK